MCNGHVRLHIKLFRHFGYVTNSVRDMSATLIRVWDNYINRAR